MGKNSKHKSTSALIVLQHYCNVKVNRRHVGEAGWETRGAFHLGKKPGNFGGSKSGISDW